MVFFISVKFESFSHKQNKKTRQKNKINETTKVKIKTKHHEQYLHPHFGNCLLCCGEEAQPICGVEMISPFWNFSCLNDVVSRVCVEGQTIQTRHQHFFMI